MAAPGSLVSAFGTGLAVETLSATALPLPQLLGATRVTVGALNGTAWPASLVFVSPTQVNFAMPVNAPPGTDVVTVYNGAALAAQGNVRVEVTAPGLFSAMGNGKGVAAAVGIRQVDVVGPQVYFPVYSCADGVCEAVPIDTGLDSPVFLALFGTGIRGAAKVTVTVGGQDVPVLYAGPQGYPGLDQVNIGLPLTLRGAGLVPVVVTADGQAANPVQVAIR
jgi:uncharacterized protein (TIGR03437 family)